MDAFTQKLLERTQERKAKLAIKREELTNSRNKRNGQTAESPVKPRRPLSEDNTDSKDQMIEESQKRRINSDSDVPKTPTTPNMPSTAKILTTPKAQSAVQAPKTPLSTTKARVGVETDTSSPSIQARREKLILMQQKDQEHKTTPKKHWKKALDMDTNENTIPNVAARSAMFENQVQEMVNTKVEFKEMEYKPTTPKTSATTPKKISTVKNVFEKKSSIKSEAAPPKPPRTIETEKTLTREKGSSKRKAPLAPTSAPNEQKHVDIVDVPVPKSKSGCSDHSIATGTNCTDDMKPAKRERMGESRSSNKGMDVRNINRDQQGPTPKPRKRRSEENGSAVSERSNDKSAKHLEDEKEKKNQEQKKARMGNHERGVISVMARAVEILEGKENAVPVEVVNIRGPRNAEKPKAKVTVVSLDTENERSRAQKKETAVDKDVKQEEVCDSVFEAGDAEKLLKPKTMNQPNKGDSRIKPARPAPSRPPLPENTSQFGSQNTNFTLDENPNLNESINLNDVNIHEMTFTFDFSNFDKIQEDRETKFQKSFDEQQRELEKERRETSSSQSSEESDVVSSYSFYEPKTKLEVEEKNMGVYKSGYNSDSSDQYATKLYKKAKSAVTEKPKSTQDLIKELLDEAASQQNIILQTSQALNVCDSSNDMFKGSQEEVEAERVLLLASERKEACLNEHQRIKNKTKETKKDRHIEVSNACPSTLSISGIRLSLKQEFMDVLRVGIRHDLGVFHFVCHVQNGPLEIHSTTSLSVNDCKEGNYLIFPDKFVLKNVNPDFSVVVKVFGMHVQKYLPSSAASSQKAKFFQSPKVAKAKRRGMDPMSPSGATPMPVFRSTNFKLIGSSRVTLSQMGSKKWTLEGISEGCPLKDHIQMKVHCTPQYTSHVKGFLTILEDVGGFSAWQRRWSVLEGGLLSYWRYPGDEATQAPLDTLDIGQCTSDHITTVPRDLCARPHTIEVLLNKNKEQVRFLLACDTKEDRITWVNCLNEALCDMKAWTKSNKGPLYPELDQGVDANGKGRTR